METYYTLEEVAKILRVSHMTIYRYIAQGRIKPYKPSHQFLFTQGMIDELLAQSVYTPKPDNGYIPKV